MEGITLEIMSSRPRGSYAISPGEIQNKCEGSDL